MHTTDLKESIQSLIDLQADAELRGYARGFDAGWAACKACYDKQRADVARTDGEEACSCGTPITQDSCPKCGTWHDLAGRR